MILAIEGPDASGKSTMLEALRPKLPAAVFVPSISLPKCLYPFAPEVAKMQAQLWNILYDPTKLYICARWLTISCPVYDDLLNRTADYDFPNWPTIVIYLRPTEEVLRRQALFRGDTPERWTYEQIVTAYDRAVKKYPVLLNPTLDEVVDAVIRKCD